ncbi:MAG: hypothetical protein WCD81_04500 [Candidatus Bathyarchaeia archaeon]
MSLALRGGLAVHILMASVGKEPKDWRHKDIDVVLLEKQLPNFIALIKSLEYVRSPLSSKTENCHVYQNEVNGRRVSVNFVGQKTLEVEAKEYDGYYYNIMPPQLLYEQIREKWISMDKNPKVARSVDFLNGYVKHQVQEKR